MSSFRLQKNIREITGLSWAFYGDSENLFLNGRWVTDIDKNFYQEAANGIRETLRESTDPGLISEVKNSLADAKRNTLKLWDDIVNGETYHERKPFSPFKPSKSTLDFLNDNEQGERKKAVFDAVIELLKLDIENFENEDLHLYLTSPEANKSNGDIIFYYSYGHLYYVLSIRVEVIENLLKELEELDESVSQQPMQQNNTNPHSMEFNLKKVDIAIFFEILFEEEIIKMEGRTKEERKRNLRKYLDNANLTYIHDGKKIPVVDIKKEFSKLKSTRLYNIVDNEKLLLEDLILKFQKRLKRLENESSGKNN